MTRRRHNEFNRWTKHKRRSSPPTRQSSLRTQLHNRWTKRSRTSKTTGTTKTHRTPSTKTPRGSQPFLIRAVGRGLSRSPPRRPELTSFKSSRSKRKTTRATTTTSRICLSSIKCFWTTIWLGQRTSRSRTCKRFWWRASTARRTWVRTILPSRIASFR